MRLFPLGLFTLALMAAAAPGFRIDPDLVDSVSAAPAGLMRAESYLVHFRKDRLNLYYVSAHHENREDSKTFAVIRRAFSVFPIKRVIVEGRVSGKDDVSVRDAAGIVREAGKGRYKAGEVDYAIALAYKKGILAVGGEPRRVRYGGHARPQLRQHDPCLSRPRATRGGRPAGALCRNDEVETEGIRDRGGSSVRLRGVRPLVRGEDWRGF